MRLSDHFCCRFILGGMMILLLASGCSWRIGGDKTSDHKSQSVSVAADQAAPLPRS
ncbi:MAG: hypothetical protein FD177_2304 [Desulfovibrionaceae bacterium]|nr:MAG: hypothetical protein FD177_2304 [Desulfovibrionaceae bacterium]